MTEETSKPEEAAARPEETPNESTDPKPTENAALDTAKTSAAKTMAADVKAQVAAMDRKDQMILFGSLALLVLGFLPWFSVSFEMGSESQSSSIGGFHGLGWLAWLAAAAAVLLTLSKTKLLGALPTSVSNLARSSRLLVELTGVALLVGPLSFWSWTSGEGFSSPMAGVDAGRTFFFLLALVAAVVAVGGALWKLRDEKKAARRPD